MIRIKRKTNIILCALCFALCVSAGLNPILGIFAIVMAAGLFGAIVYELPQKGYIFIAALCACGLYFTTGSVVATLSNMLFICGIGGVIAFCMKKGVPFRKTLVITIAFCAFLNITMSVISAYAITGTLSVESILAPYEATFNIYYDAMLSQGISPSAATSHLLDFKAQFGNVLIGYLILTSIAMTFFSFLVTRFVLIKFYHMSFPNYNYLYGFKISMVGGLFFFVSFLYTMLGSDGMMKAVALNFIMIMGLPLLLNGFSLIEWYLNKVGAKPNIKRMVYGLIFITIMFPTFSLVSGTISIGMMDSIFNYRKLKE